MNSSVRINVRATFGDAHKQFASLITEMSALDAAARRSAVGVGVLDRQIERSSAGIGAWGKKLQYAGSILTYNFAVPIIGAFALLERSEIAYQRQLANLTQVYGDVNAQTTDVAANNRALARDMQALDGTIILLSSHYGIARDKVAEVAVELGRAGDSGVSLARDTRTVVEVMRAFGLTAKDASNGLLQLRVTYGLTSAETRDAVGVVAVAAQTTRASFEGLTAAIVRAGPPAAQLGVDLRHLAAMASVMAQAGFQGGESGNALSTALQRLTVITPKAADIFKRLGIDSQGVAFQSLNAAQRIELLGEKLKGASRDSLLYASSVIFGVRQQSKLTSVLADIISGTGTYNKILKDTTDQTRVNAYFQDQLAKQLKNPAVAMDVLKETFKNNARVVAVQLLPVLLGLLGLAVKLSQAFANLDPGTQHWILLGLALVALVGPITKVIGSFGVLGGMALTVARTVGGAFGYISEAQRTKNALALENEIQTAQAIVTVERAKQSAIRAQLLVSEAEWKGALLRRNAAYAAENAVLIAEAEGALLTVRASAMGQVAAFDASVAAMTRAEEEAIVAGAAASEAAFPPLLAVIVILSVIALAAYKFRDQFLRAFEQIAEALGYIVAEIYALLQWLNPFARHSPSLVENTENGTRQMSRHWANMSRSAASSMDVVKRAIRDLNAALANGPNPGVNFNVTKGFRAVQKQGNKQDIGAYKEGMDALRILGPMVKQTEADMNAQERVVKAAKNAYDDYGLAIKKANTELRDMENQSNKMQKAVAKLGDPTALRSQATAASSMGRALLAAGNPELAAQFGAQADKLNAQADKAQKARDGLEQLSTEIEKQRDAIQQLSDTRDSLLATYDAEKEKLDVIKQQYSDLRDLVQQVTQALSQMAQAATAANSAAAAADRAAGKGKGKGGKDLNPGFPGAQASSLEGLGGNFKNEGGDLSKELDKLKAELGTKVGSMFPDPTKGVRDFFGHLNTSFHKGMDDFKKGKFEDAFGFGKGWGENLQHGLALGIGVLAVVVGRLLLGAFMSFLSGRWLVRAVTFGSEFIGGILTGAEDVGIVGAMRILAGKAIGGFGRALLSLPGLAGRAFVGVLTAMLDVPIVGTALEIAGGVVAAFLALPVEVIAAIVLAVGALAIGLYKWHDQIFEFAGKIPGWIWDGLTAAWDGAVKLGEFITTWLDKIGSTVLKAMDSFGQKFPGWIMTGVKTAWEKGFYLIGFITGWLVGQGIKGAIALGEFGKKIPGWLWDGVEKAWDKACDLAGRFNKWLKKEVVSVHNHLAEFGKTAPAAMWKGITDAWDKAMDLPGRFNKWLKKEVVATHNHLADFGKTAPPAIWKGINEAWDAAMTLAKKIKTWLAGIPATVAKDLHDLGSALVHGIAAGVTGAASALVDAGKNLVGGFLDGVKKTAGIKSPSTLFAEQVGKPIAQGIAVGISGQTMHVTNAAVAHIHAVMDAVENTAMKRSNDITLPTLTQHVAMQYSGGAPAMGGMVNTRMGGSGAAQAQGGMVQHVNVNMGDSPMTADPHQVASALAWKMRMQGAY